MSSSVPKRQTYADLTPLISRHTDVDVNCYAEVKQDVTSRRQMEPCQSQTGRHVTQTLACLKLPVCAIAIATSPELKWGFDDWTKERAGCLNKGCNIISKAVLWSKQQRRQGVSASQVRLPSLAARPGSLGWRSVRC